MGCVKLSYSTNASAVQRVKLVWRGSLVFNTLSARTPACPLPRASVMWGRYGRSSEMNPHGPVAFITSCCRAANSGVSLTPTKKMPVRSKQPNSSRPMDTGGECSLRSCVTMHSYCCRLQLPRNCNVTCHDSGMDQRSPSPFDRSRIEMDLSSSIAGAASGIPTKRRIREKCKTLPPFVSCPAKSGTNFRKIRDVMQVADGIGFSHSAHTLRNG